jgi:hypothetical protein
MPPRAKHSSLSGPFVSCIEKRFQSIVFDNNDNNFNHNKLECLSLLVTSTLAKYLSLARKKFDEVWSD